MLKKTLGTNELLVKLVTRATTKERLLWHLRWTRGGEWRKEVTHRGEGHVPENGPLYLRRQRTHRQ